MVLDLQGCGANAGVTEEIHDRLRAEVGDTDAASNLLVDQGLHGGPRLSDGRVAEFGLAVRGGPARRVAFSRVNVLQGHGEVNEEEIKVVDLQVRELLLRDGLNLVALVECVPQLGYNEQVFTLDETVLNRASNTLANFLLVAIV